MPDFFAGIAPDWRDAVDILLVTLLLYRATMLIQGTRAVAVVIGLLLLTALYFAAEQFGLYTLAWLFQSFFASLFLVVVILFQRDIRMGLSIIGTRSRWGERAVLNEELLGELVDAAVEMAHRKTGALIVIERAMPLRDVMESEGVTVDALLSQALLLTIFFHNTPLHDGAVLIRKGRITAASCILPLAVTKRQGFGTRHRAAIGITEESDAVAVVVSEERGEVSVAVKGKLTKNLDAVRLKRVLSHAL